MNKVVVIGTGKVASHLTKALLAMGADVLQIVARSQASAQRMMAEVGTTLPYTTQKSAVVNDADLYICSVKDDAISQAVDGINIPENALLVHTSGSTDSQILAPFAANYGVLYPLQTFSYGKEVDFSKIVLYIEANNTIFQNKLYIFANRLSPNVKVVDS
ncbi:MAG: NAD(P)-binding domain-containing protein, partial [Paludibacteraceae bacterium]|nr:NAD(P)-binding domain-containing protein [Paludibacteraceae bacterium]